MVTAVGTDFKLRDLVQNLAQLDKAAIEDYGAAIERLENIDYKQQLTSFREEPARAVTSPKSATLMLQRT